MTDYLPTLKQMVARKRHWLLIAVGLAVLAGALALAVAPTAAQVGSPLHPVFPLLDADGANVLDSGQPVSTLNTCGQCHDTAFITEHNAHASVLTGALTAPSGEAVMTDLETGQLVALEEAADTVEMNCFLCHTLAPNNQARLAALVDGNYDWANTATLLDTGIVEQTGDSFAWNPDAFDAQGNLLTENVNITDPTVENCGQCHGFATIDPLTPVSLHTCGTEQRNTITTGQIFSPQRISESGLNISGKDEISRTWDVHAERIVGCSDCHYALNNPAYDTEPSGTRPEHLVFDPRRLEPGEYLQRPLHVLARSSADPVTESACASCHETETTHAWLPYADRHMDKLACESCHVPRLEAPARQTVDWTLLTVSGGPINTCRSITSEGGEESLIVGYEPLLLPDENGLIAPYNLLTTYYWVAGPNAEPVKVADLQAALLDEAGNYQPEIVAAFDADGSGTLDSNELFIDTDAREAAVAAQLATLGLEDARIEAKAETYPINHGVTHGDYATRDCSTCHGEESRLSAPIALANDPPGGVTPDIPSGDPSAGGSIFTGSDGRLYFQPETGAFGDGTYVFGHTRSKVLDWAGILIFLGTLGGVFVHGGLRFVSARRRAGEAHEPELKEVYMYSVYERLWHWLQSGVILLLIFTGLVIHRPDMFGMFSFRYVVVVHNVLAGILVVNAALALFYHLASGEIKQYLPEPRGFFGQSIEQAKFYIQGIFRGDPHPFEKSPDNKLNPLQQVTYFGLLNVLLPAQIITGALMWGAQRWPALANLLGGLPVLAPIHTMVAWLFGSFVVAHIYLTTTGHEPLAGIRGMVMGWDEVETAPAPASTD